MAKPEMPPTTPLFDEPKRVAKPRTPPLRSVAQGTCPQCGQGGRRVGLLRSGTHLVWREHHYTTWNEAKMLCQASGVAVCVAPPKLNKWDTPRCPCGGS